MTDNEAMRSLIFSQLNLCLEDYPHKNEELPVKQCTFCPYREKDDCFEYKVADKACSLIDYKLRNE